ncbi:RNA-binding protein 25-like [Centruroides sculpturatus]|uniref:RNA-binding protein 25-like n=1 Tax=Centruroides sculpturatus TaxID=218467 RepID=UPI000C6E48DB|nr:RNA-binding protein 25-like [Centruroides sculpturatus]
MAPVAMTVPPSMSMAVHQKSPIKKHPMPAVPYKRPELQPQEPKGPPVTVFVGNITERASDSLIRQLLQVNFIKYITNSDGMMIKFLLILIPELQPQEPKGPPVTVFVGNITERASDSLIRQLLQIIFFYSTNYRITSCRIAILENALLADAMTKGEVNEKMYFFTLLAMSMSSFGFCEYGDPESGLRAIRLLHDWQIGDKKLVVKVDAKTKEKLDEYKATKWANQKDENEEKKEDDKEKDKSKDATKSDDVDETTKNEDEEIKNAINEIIQEHSLELSRPVETKEAVSPTEKQRKITKVQEVLMKMNQDAEKDPKNDLDEMDLEEEKKSLIHREIDKFRDTYKVGINISSKRAEEEKEKERERKERDNRSKDRNRDRDSKDRDRKSTSRRERTPLRDRDHDRIRDREREHERSPLERNRVKDRAERLATRSRSRSRDRAWSQERERSRERSRDKDVDKDREDEEDAYERKKLERKLREKEAAYQEVLIYFSCHLKNIFADFMIPVDIRNINVKFFPLLTLNLFLLILQRAEEEKEKERERKERDNRSKDRNRDRDSKDRDRKSTSRRERTPLRDRDHDRIRDREREHERSPLERNRVKDRAERLATRSRSRSRDRAWSQERERSRERIILFADFMIPVDIRNINVKFFPLLTLNLFLLILQRAEEEKEKERERKERDNRSKDRNRDRDSKDRDRKSTSRRERTPLRDRDHDRIRDREREHERSPLERNRVKDRAERLATRSRSRSRDRAWSQERERSRERSRDKDVDKDREDEEDAYERKKLERKLREKEAAYQERLRNWEARERRKGKDYDKARQKEDDQKQEELKEARRLKEFLEDYDDERDDPKYYKGSALARRLKEREKEIEADNHDRRKEKEELEELRRQLVEKGHPDPDGEIDRIHQEEQAKLFQPKVKPEPSDSEGEQEHISKMRPIASKETVPEEETKPIKRPVEDESPPNSLSGFSDVITTQEESKPLGFGVLRLGSSPTQLSRSPSTNNTTNSSNNNNSTNNTNTSSNVNDNSINNGSSNGGSTSNSNNNNQSGQKKKMTLQEVFNDDDSSEQRKKRKLIPLDDVQEESKTSSGSQQMSTEEKRKHIKNLIDKIPTDKEKLFAFNLDWSLVDKSLMERKIKPWINKKIVEYIGEEEPTLVEFICSKVLAGSAAQSILDDVSMVLDEEAEVFVVKMWRLLIYEIESKKLGLMR